MSSAPHWDAIAWLDVCIVGLATVFLLAVLTAYRLTPQLTSEEPKPSFFSFCSAAWVLPKIRGPRDPPSTLADLPDSRGTEHFNPDVFVERLQQQWSATSSRSLGMAVLRLMAPAWAAVHAVRGPGLLCALLDAYIISCIVAFVQSDGGTSIACKIAALVMLKELGTDLLFCMSWFVLHNTGVIRVIVPLQVLMLRKLRSLRPEGLALTSAADVQQLMHDARKLDDLLWSSPANTICVEIARGLVALWQLRSLYGMASITTGVATGLLLFYLQTLCAAAMREARDSERNANKSRLHDLKELTDSLETLKLYDWTGKYLEPLAKSAEIMAAAARKVGGWMALSDFLGAVIGDAFCVIAFFVSTFITGERIEFKKFVLAEVYVQVLRESVKCIYEAYSKTQDILKVTCRIEDFLRLEERSLPEQLLSSSCSASIHGDASFAWPVVSSDRRGDMELRSVLSGLNFHVEEGELVVISGPVGAGKSSLLLSLLGETVLTAGDITLADGIVAYQPQVPHLCDGTIRQNVIFGLCREDAVNEVHLQTALEASMIAVDINDEKSTLHTLGEHTLVGNRGGEISGGQRARTALARMVYAVLSGARCVLMDDPFSAIDNEMVTSAWDAAVIKAMGTRTNGINGSAAGHTSHGATRIVVLNSQLLPRLGPDADRIVLVEGGRVVYNGLPRDVMADSALLQRLGSGYEVAGDAPALTPKAPQRFHLRSVAHAVLFAQHKVGVRNGSTNGSTNLQVTDCAENGSAVDVSHTAGGDLVEFLSSSEGARQFLDKSISDDTALQLPAAEWREFRRLLQEVISQQKAAAPAKRSRDDWSSDLSIYVTFFWRMLFWTASAMSAAFLAEATTPYALTFLSAWADSNVKLGDVACYGLFATLILGKSGLNSAGGFLKQFGMAKTSHILRNSIDSKLVSLSMPYFWHGGKISDVRTVVTTDLNDFEPLSSIPIGVAQNFFGLCAVVYTVPKALPLLVLAGLAWRRVAFPKTWVFAHMIPLCNKHVYQKPFTIAGEEYDSNVVIRAMRVHKHFDDVMQRTTMQLAYARFYLWGGLLLKDVLSLPIKSVFVACAVGCVLQVQARGGDPAQALVLYNICWGLVKKINDLNWKLDKAIERLVQYRHIETFIHTEHAEGPSGIDPPKSWPEQGAISFADVSFRYFPRGPLALQGLSASIGAGEKVGIVGPTGAGKSTFLKLLFRLGPLKGVPPGSGGRVSIDGVDIATIPLGRLRRAIGVVPQEPTIFQGTLKANLGGSAESDSEALSALAACGLQELAVASSLQQELSTDLSVGQKQLLAAARVLIRRPRVLVLDEATASLSQRSADQLMEVITRHCSAATVLSISHRLRFILRCDRVLVLKRGGILEAFDAPAGLQCNPNGYFARQLRAEAERATSEPSFCLAGSDAYDEASCNSVDSCTRVAS